MLRTVTVKKAPLLLMLAVASAPSFGGEQAGDKLENKLQALKVLKSYAESVACATNLSGAALDQHLNKLYIVDRGEPDFPDVVYYGLWKGDWGCKGGAGTHSYHVSEVSRLRPSDPFSVKPNSPFDHTVSDEIDMRYIQSMTQVASNQFSIVAKQEADGDDSCCPSLTYQYSVKRDAGFGSWGVIEKSRL